MLMYMFVEHDFVKSIFEIKINRKIIFYNYINYTKNRLKLY